MMKENEGLELFVEDSVFVDTNNTQGFQYDSSCSYSKTGDCSGCCSLELVLTP